MSKKYFLVCNFLLALVAVQAQEPFSYHHFEITLDHAPRSTVSVNPFAFFSLFRENPRKKELKWRGEELHNRFGSWSAE